MRRSHNFEKRNCIRHFARFNFSRLSLAFILKYYPIVHVVKKILKLAYKNRVKLGEKSGDPFPVNSLVATYVARQQENGVLKHVRETRNH